MIHSCLVCVCVFSNTPFPRKVSCAPQHAEDTCWPPDTEVFVKNPSVEQVTVTQKLHNELEKDEVKRQPVSCNCPLTDLCRIAVNSCSTKPCFFLAFVLVGLFASWAFIFFFGLRVWWAFCLLGPFFLILTG